jgi:hypothetical protein
MNGRCRRKPLLVQAKVVWFYLKYTYRYRSQFGEPDDEWLDAIEATSEELMGAYTKVED